MVVPETTTQCIVRTTMILRLSAIISKHHVLLDTRDQVVLEINQHLGDCQRVGSISFHFYYLHNNYITLQLSSLIRYSEILINT